MGELEQADKEPTTGHIDRFGEGVVYGWAALRDGKSYRAVSVELLVDGEVVAAASAGLTRDDLRTAGIGDGAHAFKLPYPEHMWDGKEREIAVRVRETGATLPGQPRKVRLAKPATLSRLELEQSVVLVAGVREEHAELDAVSLWEDDRRLAVSGQLDAGSREFAARLPLPPELCDGRIHVLVVRAGLDGCTLGAFAAIAPLFTTPLADIIRHGGGPLAPSLDPSSRRRYDALSASLKALQAQAGGAGRIATLLQAHDAVVRGFQSATLDKPAFARLEFPQIAAPRVSVVIPAHNRFEVTYHCLAALLLAHNRASFEVILVDDGSNDATASIGELVAGITVVRNKTAQGFVHACNRGAGAARGEYVVMLNNDTEPALGWIDELLWVFEHFDNVGLAGAKLLYPDGKLQEAGGIVWGNGQPWNVGRNANAADPAYGYTREVDYLSGACIMLPAKLWKDLGGFDELYAPAYFEDTDLAFRVRQKGYKTVYAPFAEVVHFEGQSNGTSVESGVKRYQEINRPKFAKRWYAAYRNNGPAGKDVFLAKDRNVSGRALVIDFEAPRYDQAAGAYAALQEMRLLQSLGFKLTFAPDNMAHLGRYTENLQRRGIECLHAPFAPSVFDVLEKRGREFDLVYVTRYSVAAKYVEAIRKFAPAAKIMFCNADLHFLREIRQALAEKNDETMRKALATREVELAVMRQVDLVLSYSEAEHAVILSHNLDQARVAKCPWVVDVRTESRPWKKRRDIAFLGGFAHPPNRMAVEFFAREVMPILRRQLPDVRFLIYGSNIPDDIRSLESDAVEVRGWVADVFEALDACRVFVAPLRSGAGVKGKVLDAFAHGVPCVVSPVAIEGIPAADGIEVLVADKPQQWAEAVAELYGNEKKWTAMSQACSEFVRKRYSFAAGRALMKDALEQLGIFANEEASSLRVR